MSGSHGFTVGYYLTRLPALKKDGYCLYQRKTARVLDPRRLSFQIQFYVKTILSPSFNVTMAFFQLGAWPA